MRERVAADLVTPAEKRDHVAGIARHPVRRVGADQAARDIERPARAMRFEHLGAGRRRALWQVVEGKADHRRAVAQPEQIDAQMHRQPVADLCPCL